MLPQTKEIAINTKKHKLKLVLNFGLIRANKLEVKKKLFSEMCRSGCKNYDSKYSCPPLSPSFSSCLNGCNELLVLLLSIDLSQLSDSGYRDYHKLRVGNAIIKPRIERIMRHLESVFGGRYMGTGACRLCRSCQRLVNKPCRHPDKMRYSLESLGVNCNKLSIDLFNIPLLWYKDKQAPKYTSVVCALPIKDSLQKDEIIHILSNLAP